MGHRVGEMRDEISQIRWQEKSGVGGEWVYASSLCQTYRKNVKKM